MPLPTSSDVHVNAPLTNLSVAYIQDAKNFVAGKVFPIVPSEKQSNLYYIYDIGDFNRLEVRKRAPGTESAGGEFRLTTSSFFCDVYAIHKDLADEHIANADAVLDLNRAATEYVTQQLLIQLDTLWVTNYFATSIWGLDLTGVASGATGNQFNQWDASGSTPVRDIDTQREYIASQTGFLPNSLVLGPKVYAALKNNADVLDRIKYTERGSVTVDMLASLFDVENVYVPRAINNTAKEGQTKSMASLFGKNALLVYSAPSPGIEQPSGGYCFAWTGLEGAGQFGNRVSTFRMQWLKSDRVEAEMAVGMNVVGSALGVFFSGAVS